MSVTGYLVWFIATTLWVVVIIMVGVLFASGYFAPESDARKKYRPEGPQKSPPGR